MSNKVTHRKKDKKQLNNLETEKKQSTEASSSSTLRVVLTLLLLSLLTIIGLFSIGRLYSQAPSHKSDLYGLNFAQRWGTWRSGVYFGLKRNEPSSLVTGLMWFKNVLIDDSHVPLRHWCSKFDPTRYMWKKHDFESFGIQNIEEENEFTISQHVLFREDGWIAKIKLDSPNGTLSDYVSLILYFASENEADQVTVATSRSDLKNGRKVDLKGQMSGGRHFLSRIETTSSRPIVHIQDFSLHMHPPLMYFRERIMQNLGIIRSPNGNPLFILRDPPQQQQQPNFIAVQIIVDRPVELFFYLREKAEPALFDDWKNRFDSDIEEKIFQFDTKFEEVFRLSSKGYGEDKIQFAQSVLSNMLGSVGHFYGYSFIRNGTTKPEPYGPLELTTAVPSRADFPRGFLWDEGFHQLLVAKYDPSLSIKIIRNWLNLMNKEGWIPREVILGFEAMSRVPNEFIVQDISNANPPSLLLPLEYLLDSDQLDNDYLQSIYPLLERWYGWFNNSQAGYKLGTYRWRGRDPKLIDKLNPLTLTSGLDDYPRASHPSDKEIHLDLRCWMALASRILYKMGQAIGSPSAVDYEQTYNLLRDNELLDETHWSENNNMYCDFGLHSNKVELKNVSGLIQRVVLEKPVYQCVPELGYINLFPMLLNLLDADNPRLNAILTSLEDSEQLWSPHGIRSISLKSRYYMAWNTVNDPPYWRGPIWMNINFLILKSLKHYSTITGPYKEKAKEIHSKLRDNLVNNVFNVYRETGFIWEHYNDTTGQGGGVHPFTGWSSLIILIMSDEY